MPARSSTRPQRNAQPRLCSRADWSGRAEIGLVGEDVLAFKISPDGSTFNDAARFNPLTARASFPGGLAHALPGAPCRRSCPSPGDGVVSIFRLDPPRSANPRTDTLASVAGDEITLTTSSAVLFFNESAMGGVSMVRVWNTTRSPIEPAWVWQSPDASRLRVSDPVMVASWLSGDVVQIGDPTSVTSGRVIAIDVSPMMHGDAWRCISAKRFSCESSRTREWRRRIRRGRVP